MRYLLFFVAALCIVIVTAALAQQPSLKPIATVEQLMTTMIAPSSNVIFGAASEAPKGDGNWIVVRNYALTLAESGNLLMIGDRARDRGEWMKMATSLRDAAEAAVKAVDARSADALAEAGERVYETCGQCHARYMTGAEPVSQ